MSIRSAGTNPADMPLVLRATTDTTTVDAEVSDPPEGLVSEPTSNPTPARPTRATSRDALRAFTASQTSAQLRQRLDAQLPGTRPAAPDLSLAAGAMENGVLAATTANEEPVLEPSQIAPLLAKDTWTNQERDNLLQSLRSFPPAELRQLVFGTFNPIQRNDLARFLNDSASGVGINSSEVIEANQLKTRRAVENLGAAVLAGNPTGTEEQRIDEARRLFNILSAAETSPGGIEAPRNLTVTALANGLAKNIDAGLALPPDPAAVNARVEGILNRLTVTPTGGAPAFVRGPMAYAVAPLVGALTGTVSKSETVDRLFGSWSPAQVDQISKAVMDPRFLAINSATPSTSDPETVVPGALERFVSNMNTLTNPGQRAQFMESLMINLDRANQPVVGLSREETVDKALGALTNELLLDPNGHMAALYQEDNVDAENVFNPNGRAFATYVKNMFESGFVSDIQALGNAITLPDGFVVEVDPTTGAVSNADAVEQARYDHFLRTETINGQTVYPGTFVGGYFAGSIQRAVNQLEAEGKDTEDLRSSWASAGIDVASTAIQIALPSAAGQIATATIAEAAKLWAPNFFGNPVDVASFYNGITQRLIPDDPETSVQLGQEFTLPDGERPVQTLLGIGSNIINFAWG